MPPTNKSRKKKARWMKKQQQKEVWHGLKDDFVVVVMGQTGVGKSTFVHHLLLDVDLDTSVNRPDIGEELNSCTIDLEPFVIPNGKNRIVIVDTPGFDHTFTADSEIMRRITEWLTFSYSKDMKLSGVIYLYDMSRPRMFDTTQKNFEIFQWLCGTDAAKAVVLGMTKSEELPRDVRKKREKQLQDKFWTEIIRRGARMESFKKTSASAWKILYLILGSRIDEQLHPVILQIRNELVDPHPLILQNNNEHVDPYPLILQIQKELVDPHPLILQDQNELVESHPLILQIQKELAELDNIQKELDKILPSTTAGKKPRYTLEEVLEMQKNSAEALQSQSAGQGLSAKLLKEKLVEGEVGPHRESRPSDIPVICPQWPLATRQDLFRFEGLKVE